MANEQDTVTLEDLNSILLEVFQEVDSLREQLTKKGQAQNE